MAWEELPEGWAAVQLGELVSPSKEKVEPKEWAEAAYLGLEHVESHTNRILGYGLAEDVRSTKTVFRAGDVLYGKLRPYLNKVCAPDFSGICSTDFLVFPQTPWIKSRLLLCFLSRPEVVEVTNHHSTGVELPRTNFNVLAGLQFPLPPLAEQIRIVAKIDELLQHVSAAGEHLAKVPKVLKAFRQSVLAAACSGRLTEDWRGRNAESGDFQTTTVGLAADYLGGFAYKSSTFLDRGTNQVIRIGNVHSLYLDRNASPVYIPNEIARATDRFRLAPEDIVISMTGTKYKRDYGFAAVVPEGTQSLYLNQRVARLRCRDLVLPQFLLLWLQTDDFRNFFFEGETGNVNQGNVGAGGIRNAPIALPTVSEQREIVRRVQVLFQLAAKIEKRVEAATKRADKLTQSVLAKAFRGELVPTEAELARREGRGYEPASVLLERIKAQPRPTRRSQLF